MQGARSPIMVAMPFAATVLLPVAFNWLQEERVGGEWDATSAAKPRRCGANARRKIRREFKLFILALVMGCVSLTMVVVGLTSTDQRINLVASIMSAIILIGGFWLLTPRVVAKLVTYFFLHSLFNVSIQSGSFYFFTDSKKLYPEGPHFSTEFYTTAIGLVSTFFHFIGITLYNCFMHKVRRVYVYELRV